MADPEIIDFHTHTFVSADRGLGWQRSLGITETTRTGAIDNLHSTMQEAGISRSVMLMYTPTRFMYEARIRNIEWPEDSEARAQTEREIQSMMAQRMIENNEWACTVSAEHSDLIAFAGLDPVYMDEQTMVGEIDDKVAKGAKGVKIVPLALAIYVDDPRLWPAYERISELGIPMVSQAGAGGENGDRGDAHGRPKYFAKALEEFPDLVVNLAHLGHGYEEDVIDLCGRFPNLYADMSSRLHEIGDPDEELTADSLVEFIRACGVEHIMFGTNYPLNDPVLYAEVMRTLPLTDDERELVSSGNAKRLLGG